ncbi:hypothetical protein ACOKGD_02580 [Microbacterium phosphatis]|uniref:hypothetical protein n=1 Tax=Microbacterium phosphatis TaxID=3140248 RepID=UPI0031404325
MRQSLTITAPDAPASARARPADAIDLAETGRFPDVGVESSTAPDPVPRSSAGRFRVVELDLATPSWPAALERAARDGLPLDVRLVAAGDEALDPVAAALVGRPVARVTAFDRSRHVTTAAIARSLRAALDGAGVAAPIGSGARSHFTELNREQHELARDVDAVTMTTTPLFHTLDTEQLVEAVAMQRLIAEQAVRIAGGLPVHIGPVSLRPRYNNVATSPQPLPSRDDLAEGYGAEFTGAADERQGAPELAAWVVASAAALAVPGVETLSWFETWGPRGLADASGERPVSHAIACLAELHGAALLSGASPDGLVWAIGGRRGDGDTVLAANLDRTQRSFVVRIAGGAAHEVTLAAGAWTRIG